MKFDRKLKASTILEVIISMIVITIVFGIAITIFSNVTRSSLSSQKLKAMAVLRDKLDSAERGLQQPDSISEAGGFRIERHIKPYNSSKYLLEIDLAAYDENQRKIAELQKVIVGSHAK